MFVCAHMLSGPPSLLTAYLSFMVFSLVDVITGCIMLFHLCVVCGCASLTNSHLNINTPTLLRNTYPYTQTTHSQKWKVVESSQNDNIKVIPWYLMLLNDINVPWTNITILKNKKNLILWYIWILINFFLQCTIIIPCFKIYSEIFWTIWK